MSLQPWFKEFAQQQIEGCFGFIFTEDIQLFLLSASLLLRIVSDLPTCDLITLKDRLILQARPFQFPW